MTGEPGGSGDARPVWQLFESSVADPEQAVAWAEAFGSDMRAAWRSCPRAGWMLRLAAASKIDARLYVRASLASVKRVLVMVPEAEAAIAEDLRVLEAWVEGRVEDSVARAAIEHANRKASACGVRQADPPSPERDERYRRSLAMRVVARAAEGALGRIASGYCWPTAADLTRSVARLVGGDLQQHDREAVGAIAAIVPESAIVSGVPLPAKVIVEPCYVEVGIRDPAAWDALVAVWSEVVRLKAEYALDSDAELWARLAPSERLDEVRNAIDGIALAEYEAYSAVRLDGAGRLRFDPLAFPYGGTAPIRWLVEAFGLPVVAQDDGTGRQECD